MHVCVTGDRPRHSHSHSHLNEIRRYHFGLSSAFLKRAAWYVTILTTNAARVQFPRQVFSPQAPDRKSTRLNSSHLGISYAVFCLKKKNKPDRENHSGRPKRRTSSAPTPYASQ